jgi:hypothetical protein
MELFISSALNWGLFDTRQTAYYSDITSLNYCSALWFKETDAYFMTKRICLSFIQTLTVENFTL